MCAGFTGLLCDDFESTLAKWTVDPANGTATITAGAARSGSSGLHVTLNGSGRSVLYADFAPLTSGPIYISAWVRLATGAPLTGWLVLFELRQNPQTTQKISLDGEWNDIVQLNVATASIIKKSGTGELPRGT